MEQEKKENRGFINRGQKSERMNEKAEHDEAQTPDEAGKQDFAEGYVNSFAKGVTGSIAEVTKNIARNMLKKNAPIDTIVAATGLTSEQIEQLAMDKTMDN
ncbi:MAG: hypothetical protein FWF88_04165 [Peptococcaceae bacterium]|nr:hypothetical protein [Peptococcaceae bacterium]